MSDTYRYAAIQKILSMPQEQVSKVLIFMAGMEAENRIQKNEQGSEKQAALQEEPKKIF